jgi:mRNA interferase HicA
MKRRKLLRHLSSQGCVLLREGGNHSWWLNPLKN